SAAVSRLYEVWSNYRHLPDAEWKRVVSAILRNAMLGALKKEYRQSSRFFMPATEPDTVNCRPKRQVSVEADEVEDHSGEGGIREVEYRLDLEILQRMAERILTPAQKRVMEEIFRDPSASSEQIARTLGDVSPEAVRIHKYHARRSLKLCNNKHINKTPAGVTLYL
ncbi:MAG: hypothetical protein PHI18_07215, partial [bacterium]|nr:hypothetical protein [bacterium]